MNRTHMKAFPDGIPAKEKFRPSHRVTSKSGTADFFIHYATIMFQTDDKTKFQNI